MPMNYDMHIHTEYCGHGFGMTIEAILRHADELGLHTIAITDHVFRPADLPIISRIRREVERYKTKCRVIIGAEIDVDGDCSDGRLVTDNFLGMDYVIAGFHYVPTIGNYPHCPEDCDLRPDDFLKVWRSSLLGIVSNPAVDTLAHPGRLVAASVDLDVHFDDILAVFAQAATLSAENNVAWEINELTGCRLCDYYQKQWYRLYQIGLDAGVKLIYGSDAHDPSSIAMSDFTQMVLESLPAGCLSQPDDVLRPRM